MAALLSPRVEQFARRSARAVRLDELYRWGRGDAQGRLRMARFLRQEVAIRNAQLCKELQLLPFGLSETRGISKVVTWFSSYVDRLAEVPEPEDEAQQARFTALLGSILEDNSDVVMTVGEAVRELRERLGPEAYEEVRPEVDIILDRFFIKRIGLRFLLAHHVESAQQRPGASGIIHSDVKVGPVLRRAAKEAKALCEEKYGTAPEVEVRGDGMGQVGMGSSNEEVNFTHDRSFTYVPMHLHFSCSVLLQNACFAVAQRHRHSSCRPPLVRAIFAHGEEEVTVKVSDEGGGIPRSDLPLAWSYFSPSAAHRHSTPLGEGNPPGTGLPLARLHARYYGGDLQLKSLEGFGTDAYLFVNRLGQNCENLPQGVRISPSMSDSALDSAAASIRLESLGTIHEVEEDFLQWRLREFRAAREAAAGAPAQRA